MKNGCPIWQETIETKWPDGKDGENDEERSRRKKDGKKSITPTHSKNVHVMVTNSP